MYQTNEKEQEEYARQNGSSTLAGMDVWPKAYLNVSLLTLTPTSNLTLTL